MSLENKNFEKKQPNKLIVRKILQNAVEIN